ncbi:MAG: hypothetical protein VX747_13450, partial [Actinomycetota bacterium]|nr:hypothetical protein [Actinomycetota bacterium]
MGWATRLQLIGCPGISGHLSKSRKSCETRTRSRTTYGRRDTSRSTKECGRTVSKQVKQLDRVIIRFAGDSGDGMQLT